MAEVEGQAVQQPQTLEDAAANVAEGILRQSGLLPQEEIQEPESEEEAEVEAQPEVEAEEEAEPEASETETEEESQPELFKLTVKSEDGSDVEVEEDLDGLKKGYMLEKSYRQKTAQLAREREALQSKIQEAIGPKMKELDEKLALNEAILVNALAPEMNTTDWAKLAEDDPAEWARRKAKVDGVQQQLQKVQHQRQELMRSQQEEQQRALQKAVREARETLETDLPGWSDETYGRVLKSAMDNYGFRQEEVAQIFDARAIKVLHDAMQYQSLKAKPVVDKRVPPKVPKVMKPGAGTKPDPKAEQRKAQIAKFRKSGKIQDAVPLAESIVDRFMR